MFDAAAPRSRTSSAPEKPDDSRAAGATTAVDGKLRGKNDVCGVRCSFQSGAHARSRTVRVRISSARSVDFPERNWKTCFGFDAFA